MPPKRKEVVADNNPEKKTKREPASRWLEWSWDRPTKLTLPEFRAKEELLKRKCHESGAEKWVFHGESGQDHDTFSGCLYIHKRARPSAIRSLWNGDFSGIAVRRASSDSIHAVQKYWRPSETRCCGPNDDTQ